MCPECRTTDASFPLITGCKSCAEAISRDEHTFWNNIKYPYLDPEDAEMTPGDFLRQVFQPWRAFFDFLFLG